MDPCSECGNRALRARDYDGVTVLECELCGAVTGSDRAVAHARSAQEAARRGVAPAVYPLVDALDRLDGLRVDAAGAGSTSSRTLPFVRIVALDARALVQLENLAKSLQLAARSLQLPWGIEVEFQASLGFRLAPRPAAAITDAVVRAAVADLTVLQRGLDRDVRLGWWRHPQLPA